MLSHFKTFKPTLYAVILESVFMIAVMYYNKFDVDLAIKIFAFIIIIRTSPSIYLHFLYYEENKNLNLTWNSSSLEISDSKKNNTIVLTNDNVKLIDIYASATLLETGLPGGRFPHESYHYAIVKYDNNFIILTSLLYPDLMRIGVKLGTSKVSFNKKFFASF